MVQVKISGKSVAIFLPVLVILFQIVCLANGASRFAVLEALKPNQRQALAEFKKLVSPIVHHDYMKEDIYLIRFLSFNNFKVQKAQEHLKEMLKWRSDNDIDGLVNNPPEAFAALGKDYPIYVDGYDKEERPICEVPFGSWPVRKAAAAGLIKNVTLFMFVNCAERLTTKVRELQAQGKNVTEWVFMANMDGFSIASHVCPACTPLSLNLGAGNDRYYPQLAHGFWLINTPESFAVLFRLLRPVMSPPARAAMKIFTSNEAEYKPFLEKRIDMNEISDWYGGVKERKPL